ncbi:MAG: hypothetical protein JXL97_17570 [Bacteroidales bacterium]|nr:hypothetical protein [Bacteroidales bacterium]
MEAVIKKLKLIFIVVFVQFAVIAGIVVLLKTQEIVKDTIDLSNKLTMIIPILMIASILVAYFIYDRIARLSRKIEVDEQKRLKNYFSASMIKIAMFDFVGILVSIMLLLFYQQTYLYMLGIIIIFFLMNLPNETKYKKDFEPPKESFFDR